jgi:hypothetical protein
MLDAMKNQNNKKVAEHGKEHVSNHRNNSPVYKEEPIPNELLEKPSDAKQKAWTNNEMPSDFWL